MSVRVTPLLVVEDREIDSDGPIDKAACEQAIKVIKLMRENDEAIEQALRIKDL
jgi:hypothetical protein